MATETINPNDLSAASSGTNVAIVFNQTTGQEYKQELDYDAQTQIDDKLNISDLDDTPADDSETAVTSKWTYDNVKTGYKWEELGSDLTLATTSSYTVFTYTIPTGGGVFSFNSVLNVSNDTVPVTDGVNVNLSIDSTVTVGNLYTAFVSSQAEYKKVPIVYSGSFSGGEVVTIKASSLAGGSGTYVTSQSHWKIETKINPYTL